MRFFVYIFASLFASVASSQNLAKDSVALQKILKKATKNSKNPGVYEIKGASEIKFVTSYIDAKNKQSGKKAEVFIQKENNTLGARYRNGDKSVLPQLKAILIGKDLPKIQQLFDELTYEYDGNQPVHELDPEIRDLVFDLVTNDSIGFSVVQYLGFNNIDGHVALFEQNLKNENPVDADRVFFWLSKANSGFVREYMIAKFDQDEILGDSWNTLGHYLNEGSEAEKKRLRDAIYAYFDRNPISETDFAKPFGEFSSNDRNTRFSLWLTIVESGDGRSIALVEKALPIAKKLKPEKIGDLDEVMKVMTLKYRKPDERKAIFLKIIEQNLKDSFSFAKSDDYLYEEPDVNAALIAVWRKEPSHSNSELVDYFDKKSQAEFDALISKTVPGADERQSLSQDFALHKKTFDDHAAYLLQIGLIDSAITPQMVSDFKKESGYPKVLYNDLQTAIQIAGIGFSFDAEGVVPNDYADLLKGFASKSKGKLKGLKSYVQAGNFNDDIGYEYRFLVSDGKKAYVAITRDSGDWYDMETFDKLLAKLIYDAKIQEKFYGLSGGNDAFYVFAEPGKIQKLITDYRLTNYWETK